MTRHRDYKREYKYHGTPEQIKARVSRDKARDMMVKAGKVKKGDGKEIDHIDGNPLNNSPSNLRVVSRKANREKGGK